MSTVLAQWKRFADNERVPSSLFVFSPSVDHALLLFPLPCAVRYDRRRTVIQAFRIADLAKGSEILTSSLTHELVQSAGDLHFGAPREVSLKGLSGAHGVVPLEWQ